MKIKYCRECGSSITREVIVKGTNNDFDTNTGKQRNYLSCSNPNCADGPCRIYGNQGHQARWWGGDKCRCGVDFLSRY